MKTTIVVDTILDLFSEETDDDFNENDALALLLINDVIILNENWWQKEWPEEAKKTFALAVNCSDTFYYASADAEDLLYSELKDLYLHYKVDPAWGPTIWCCKKRNMLPMDALVKEIAAAGNWNLSEMKLNENPHNRSIS